MGVSGGRYHSFLIRIWSQQGRIIHGEVTHTSTRRSAHFRAFPRLLGFILAGLRTTEEEQLAQDGSELEAELAGLELPLAQAPGSGLHMGGPGTNGRLTGD